MNNAVLALSNPKGSIKKNVANKTAVFLIPIVPINQDNLLFIIGSSFPLGGSFIMFGLAGSTPKANAGRPSVNKLIHKICTGNKMGLSSVKNIVAKNKTNTSAKLHTNR